MATREWALLIPRELDVLKGYLAGDPGSKYTHKAWGQECRGSGFFSLPFLPHSPCPWCYLGTTLFPVCTDAAVLTSGKFWAPIGELCFLDLKGLSSNSFRNGAEEVSNGGPSPPHVSDHREAAWPHSE